MKTIEITDEQYEMLKGLQHELKTQDNLMTAHPMFCVYSKRGPTDFATACFTRKGCEHFIQLDGHNHKQPNIYARSANRNTEFQLIREFLMTVKLTP